MCIHRQYYDATILADCSSASRPLRVSLLSYTIREYRIANSYALSRYLVGVSEYVELCCLSRGSHVLVVPASFLDNGWGLWGTLLEQEVALDEVRQPGGQLVVEEGLGRDRKDLIDFLESELLGFADKGEDHEPCNQV